MAKSSSRQVSVVIWCLAIALLGAHCQTLTLRAGNTTVLSLDRGTESVVAAAGGFHGNGAGLDLTANPAITRLRGWYYVGGIPSVRYCGVAASLTSENVVYYGFGGNSAGFIADWWQIRVDTSRPWQTSWQQLSAPPLSPRCYGVAVSTGDSVFVGFGGYSTTWFGDWWRFNATSGVWLQRAGIPDPSIPARVGPFAVSLNGLIYAGLGRNGTADQYLADWWSFDDSTNSWTQLQSLPGQGRHLGAVSAVGSKIYAGIGTINGGFSYLSDWYEYDPGTDQWTPKAPLPYAGLGRSQTSAVTIRGKIHVAFGNGDLEAGAPFQDVWVYDPSVDAWAPLPYAFPGLPRTQHVGVSLENNTMMMVGTGTPPTAGVYLGDWWVLIPPLP